MHRIEELIEKAREAQGPRNDKATRATGLLAESNAILAGEIRELRLKLTKYIKDEETGWP